MHAYRFVAFIQLSERQIKLILSFKRFETKLFEVTEFLPRIQVLKFKFQFNVTMYRQHESIVRQSQQPIRRSLSNFVPTEHAPQAAVTAGCRQLTVACRNPIAVIKFLSASDTFFKTFFASIFWFSLANLDSLCALKFYLFINLIF